MSEEDSMCQASNTAVGTDGIAPDGALQSGDGAEALAKAFWESQCADDGDLEKWDYLHLVGRDREGSSLKADIIRHMRNALRSQSPIEEAPADTAPLKTGGQPDTYDKKAREIAHPEGWNVILHCNSDARTAGGHCKACRDLQSAIFTCVSEAVAVERRETMALLGCDEDGKRMPSREVVSGGMTIAVSDDAYYNLEGALIDLKHQNADAVCIRTIERVQAQIAAVVSRVRGETK